MSVLTAISLAGVAIGYHQGRVFVVIALFFLGIGYGSWDVAMNVQGATVERLLGRAIMSRFHAGFSIATVAGALAGTAMVALDVPVTIHLLVVAVALSIAVPIGVRSFVPDTAAQDEPVDSAAAAPTTPESHSLGFPVGMSAGADEPPMAAARVSVIASIGYCAFLAGPPVIGFIGEQITVLRAIIVVAAVLALALVITGSLRPPTSSRTPSTTERQPTE